MHSSFIYGRVRPLVSPNKGFIKQLEVFQDMGCELDVENGQYKAWEATLHTPEAVAVKLQAEERDAFAKMKPGTSAFRL